MKTIEELKYYIDSEFVNPMDAEWMKGLIDEAVSIATKEAVEREKNRVCKNCKYLDEYLMCSNPKVLNGSNFIPEFINAKQAENFGCTKWEILSTPQPEETQSESLNCYDIHEMQKMAGKRKPTKFNPAKSSLIQFSTPQPEDVCEWEKSKKTNKLYFTFCKESYSKQPDEIPETCPNCGKPIKVKED